MIVPLVLAIGWCDRPFHMPGFSPPARAIPLNFAAEAWECLTGYEQPFGMVPSYFVSGDCTA
jgi:hypothetical protein